MSWTPPRRPARFPGRSRVVGAPRAGRNVLARLAIGALACLLLAASPARAATFQDMDLDALVDASARIVRGVIVGTRARLAGGGSDRIVTDVTVAVDEDLVADGAPAVDTVVFTTLGGVVGDRAQLVPGLPAYRAGDEVVLFLGPRGVADAASRVERRAVVGLALGAFFVSRPPDGSPARVFRDLRDALRVPTRSELGAMPSTLDALARSVRARAASRRPGGGTP